MYSSVLKAMGVRVLNSRPMEKAVDDRSWNLRSAEAVGLDLEQVSTIQARPEARRESLWCAGLKLSTSSNIIGVEPNLWYPYSVLPVQL